MEIFDTPQKDQLCEPRLELNREQQHEYHFVGRQKYIPGHTLFSLNLKTGEIKPADVVVESSVVYGVGVVNHRRINIEDHCVYRQALNRKNFIKRMLRDGFLVLRKGPQNNIKHETP